MKTKFIILLTFLICVSAFAQRPNKEKLKALKIAHITEQLDLTENEAQAFWPIYNANEEAQSKLREQSIIRRKEKKADDLSEAEAKAVILEMLDTESKKQQLNNDFINKLLTILPAKKVISLLHTERSFRQKMLKEWKERHRGERLEKKRN